MYEPQDPGQLILPQRLREELHHLNPTPAGDPAVDATVMRRARVHLNQVRRGGFSMRRWSLVGAAAAAALALVVLPPAWRDGGAGRGNWAREDVNRDGRVDILDALALARRIEAQSTSGMAWDFTGDRVMDRRDVDVIALAAVRLDRRDVR